jgi:hypothetical protein
MKTTVYEDTQSKYHPGDIVYAKENPTLLLVVRRYTNKIYYCMVQDETVQKQLVYFERDLMSPAN